MRIRTTIVSRAANAGRRGGSGRIAHLGRVGLLAALLAVPGRAGATGITFDCDLATRRIEGIVEEMGKDVRQHAELKANLATRTGVLVTERQAAESTALRRLSGYIERILPKKIDDLQKNVQQARARDCMSEEQALTIVDRAKTEVGQVSGEPAKP